MKISITLVFLFMVTVGFTQTDTLNKFNAKGKKHGYWLVKLNNNLCPADSNDISFYAYERFDNGIPIISLECPNWQKECKSEFTPDAKFNPTTKFISGSLKILNEDGSSISAYTFLDGILKRMEVYYRYQDNTLGSTEIFDFEKKYNNEDGSWRYENIHSDHHNEFGWFRKGKKGWRVYSEKDSISKYPYIKNYTPPLLAVQLGYDFLQKKQIEIGVIWNISDNYDIKTGSLIGPSVSYKRILDNKTNTINLGIGMYLPFSFGFDVNYNFNETERLLGFKPFIGTMFYNIQLLYGYNFFRKSRNDILNLNHHSLTLRIAIPVKVLKTYLK